ncbi:LacI family DNA-binding transcriptional regulator [Deinococcus sp. YIM 134068]|uniref:LacI family DNA-binding transcriptional regulator n=1 Tax=Deinococcus lichenicola TaxID=3118910 RepID=UPI002F94D1BD
MTRPRVRDVARVAGVGASTVSRVLNGRPHISARVRERVLAAVESLGYTPDLNARSLRSGQTGAVSVLLPMTGTPFYETLLTAVHTRLEAADLDLALFPLMGGQRVRRFRDPGALLYRADGLLIVSQRPDTLYHGHPPFAGPVVLVDAHHPEYHSVSFDNLGAGRMAGELALSRGLPVVLLSAAEVPGELDSPVFVERREGVLEVLAGRGVFPALTVPVPATLEGGREGARQLLARRPPGPFFLLALSDDLAVGAARALADAGVRPGRDYLLLGFDGGAAAAEAGISSVAQPVAGMGEAAAEVLLGALAGEERGLSARVFAPTLLERASTVLQGG